MNLSNLEVDGLTVGSLLNQPGVRGEGLPVHHGGDGDDDCEADDGEDVVGNDADNDRSWPIHNDCQDHDHDSFYG